jgi:hypothetical protein
MNPSIFPIVAVEIGDALYRVLMVSWSPGDTAPPEIKRSRTPMEEVEASYFRAHLARHIYHPPVR